MATITQLFLEALAASLRDEKVNWTQEISDQEWRSIFQMAQIHNLSPMIYETVMDTPFFAVNAAQLAQRLKRDIIHQVMIQSMREAEFAELFDYLRKNGITPCVVKGVICRNLYLKPDYRISGDEDVFILEEQFARCHELLLQYGMVLSEPGMDIGKAYEVPYIRPGSPLYIELHKHLFPPESEAYGDLNRFFDGIHTREGRTHAGNCGLMEEEIGGTKYLTMNPTDHLLYLILHSFKHFLHSGFGLRQVCDINLYAMAKGNEIDWNYILDTLREVRADMFVVSLFRIGEKYLNFDPKKACYPDYWRAIKVDEEAMLTDLLEAGVFGQADMSRKHSSNITLNAMIAEKRGKKASSGRGIAVLKSVFLPVDKLKGKYHYLEKYPFLLPVAWTQRVISYQKETAGNKSGNNAAESIRIGSDRVALMKEYGIIGEGKKKEPIMRRIFHYICDKPVLSKLATVCYYVLDWFQYHYYDFKWMIQGESLPTKDEVCKLNKDVTFIFKSFERKKLAARLYRSIQKYYPGAKVIIADDSKIPLKIRGKGDTLTIIHLPFNSGLTVGLAKALEVVETPYVIRLDDDQCICRKTHFERQYEFLQTHPQVGLASVLQFTTPKCESFSKTVMEFAKNDLSQAGAQLLISHGTMLDDNHVVFGKCSNVYIARTDLIREIGFNTNIRMLDHTDFFVRASGKMVSVVDIHACVHHTHNRFDTHYQHYRSDVKKDSEYLGKLWRG